VDWGFYALIAGGFGLLGLGARRRAATTERRTARLGLGPRPDLTHVPVELQQTVLWTLCDGGTERSVIGGRVEVPGGEVDVTCFDLEDLRHKRMEWAWLEVAPPFRLHTPLTVVVCALPRALPHLLVKRAGPADRIEPRDSERPVRVHAGAAGAVDLVGAVTTGLATRAALKVIEARSTPEPPPPSLAREALRGLADAPWHVWAGADPGEAARRLATALITGLERDSHGREWVIETLGPALVAYVASGGPLGEAGLEELVDLVAGACERVLAATPAT
jgi:hypothetical protein